jgi:hypothetical protein
MARWGVLQQCPWTHLVAEFHFALMIAEKGDSVNAWKRIRAEHGAIGN